MSPDDHPGTASPPATSDAQPPTAEQERTAELAETVAELAAGDVDPARRRQLVRRVSDAVRVRGVGDLFRPRLAVRWLATAVGEVAPYIPVRDAATLGRHHDGLTGEQLAERLIRNAAIATAGVGAAGGGIAAVEWVVTPALLSAPVLLAAETVAVVAIEMKLIGELHEVYGVPIGGPATHRAVSLLQSWAEQRGVNPMMPGVGVSAALSTAARRELGDRLLRRFGRNLTTLGPVLTGAAVAGFLNRRATKAMGDRIREDLRHQRPPIGPG
ncbi:hypothetical protein [Rhizomonospora bruguierae]|uniref:hypothetical protein n=1 Tax=Rhizomonospora bruguierae TaxID=1581705 RepID=UPI0020BD9E96|nr:hypothetical protein [Micromonospora sp. NBRC 107566]